MPSHTTDPLSPSELGVRAARALIVRELGREQLGQLHKPNLALDLINVGGAIALFLLLAFQLATRAISDPVWWACLLLQGNLILVMAYLNHDVFVHRKLFPRRLRWLVASLLVWPSQLRAGTYERQHLKHHRSLGTQDDSELYKHSLNTPLRRVLYATAAAMFYRAFVLGNKTASQSLSADAGAASGSLTGERARFERRVWLVTCAVAIAVAVWDWRLVVYGYLLPYAVVTPLLNTTRIVLEHFDLDAGNPLWIGTFYRTGPVTRLMFWWDAGDCHLVHHFYPSIPSYRMTKALALMRPILIRHGVYEQRSLLQLMGQWFSGSRAHWSVPAEAACTPASATEGSTKA